MCCPGLLSGFERVGVAAHPEGHPDIGADGLEDALVRKAAWAAREGADLYYVTQFCFAAEPVIAWERRARAALQSVGGEPPKVRLGVAGPAKLSSLLKFGALAGVGNSLDFLKKRGTDAFRLAATVDGPGPVPNYCVRREVDIARAPQAAPDAFIAGIAAVDDPDALFDGLHFYPFGGFGNTVRWAAAVERGDFHVRSDGFDVTAEAP